MDLDRAREFVRENHRAIMTTSRDDGTPQMSPVAVAVDEQGRLTVSTRETSIKVRNLRKRPTAWLCVFTDQFFGPWIQVEGETTVLSLPEAMEPLVDYYRSVAGEHPDWDEYRAAMEREQRVLVLVTPRRAGPDVSG